VAARHDKPRLLRDALGGEAERVKLVDMARLGRNPACIIPAWREFVLEGGTGPLLGIGEPVWPGRSDAELAECRRHESLLNLAFDDGGDWRLLCPYDADAIDPAVLADARQSHRHVREQGSSRPSADYIETAMLLASDGALAEPAAEPTKLAFGPTTSTSCARSSPSAPGRSSTACARSTSCSPSTSSRPTRSVTAAAAGRCAPGRSRTRSWSRSSIAASSRTRSPAASALRT
jgi:hypothetical protein